MSPTPFAVESEALEGGVRAFTVRGELDMHTAPELGRHLDEALASPDASILLDLSECEFIDSTGIALIVRSWQQLNPNDGEGGGRLALCCINHQVRRLLDVTGIGESIPMHEARDAALAELRD